VYRYVLLGLLQGLTEFLPVSSSGHLVLAQRLLGLDSPGVALEAALHLGTLLAVVIYFWGDVARLAAGSLRPSGREERRYVLFLALATLPIALAGFLGRDLLERAFSSPRLVGALLLVTALVLAAASLLSPRRRGVVLGDAIWVGIAQVAALLPGISRSGITISAGLLRGLSPEEAARFSFLLSIPAVAGAGVLGLLDGGGQAGEGAGLLVGALVALASGLGAIHFLLRLLYRGRLWWFSVYCLAVGIVALVL
jgi:undecaprenyl-diphosphatase